MDNEEYKQKLTEVADWEIPDAKFDGTSRRRLSRGRPTNEELIERSNEQEFLEKYGGKNPTMALEIKKVHVAAVTCEDCGKHCPNGRRVEAKQHESNNVIHWRKRCVTCNMTQNPWTKNYDLKPGQAGIAWNDYWRYSNGPNGKSKRKFEIPDRPNQNLIVDNDHERIVSYMIIKDSDK